MKIKTYYGIDSKISQCLDIKVPNEWVIDTEADLYIYVTANHSLPDTDYFVYGSMCDIDKGSFRPSIGQIQFNLNSLNTLSYMKDV